MATRKRVRNESHEILTLHEMFRVVGDQLTPVEVKKIQRVYRDINPPVSRMKFTDGYSFLLALEKAKQVDESNFKDIFSTLGLINRKDLSQFVSLKRRTTVEPDPVDVYLEETARSNTIFPTSMKRPFSEVDCSPTPSTSTSPSHGPPPAKRIRRSERHTKAYTTIENTNLVQKHVPGSSYDEIRKKVTCDIRLRVRAEYCHHESALDGNIFSNKQELVERQFEKFTQASTILKSRDLGSITCDIKFSELTYLDAFWRDYINGSLLEALKGVFITESLKQAVGHEAIKLLVNVDEDDYEAGRLKLLQNLQD